MDTDGETPASAMIDHITKVSNAYLSLTIEDGGIFMLYLGIQYVSGQDHRAKTTVTHCSLASIGGSWSGHMH